MNTVTVKEAAERLGIQEQAVRKRIRSGTLDSYKDDNGRVMVYLPEDTSINTEFRDRYISDLESQVAYLKGLLEREQQASSELRRVVALQAQRLPEIQSGEPRREATYSHENYGTASTPAGGHEDPERGTQTQQRSLLSRLRDAIRG